ncbi:MAG TPA: hypothetical protein VGP95_02225 [Gemmatimonadaceae bacterium]|nr:hypothetical protein [Gemmatimonadaceae bacterium]
MILREWLETRRPAPPPRLLHRIVEVLGPDATAEANADVLVGAAARLLRELTARPTLARDSALDLLTVDALVTYSLECAAASPETLVDATTSAIGRLGALVE